MSLRKAINDHCKECIVDPILGHGTWRQQVAACTSPECSLYPVRPMPSLGAKRADSEPTTDELSEVIPEVGVNHLGAEL